MLRFHGDAEVAPGLVDLAVNVRQDTLPSWLTDPIAATLAHLARYPDPVEAPAAIAARHGRPADEVLLTAGAAQAFTLLAQVLRPDTRWWCIRSSPSRRRRCSPRATRWTGCCSSADEASIALPNPRRRRSGRRRQSDQPDLGVCTRHAMLALARPGRVSWSTRRSPTRSRRARDAGDRAIRDVVVIRSLTKTWGLAGLRIGYLLGRPRPDRRARTGTPAVAASPRPPSPPPWPAPRRRAWRPSGPSPSGSPSTGTILSPRCARAGRRGRRHPAQLVRADQGPGGTGARGAAGARLRGATWRNVPGTGRRTGYVSRCGTLPRVTRSSPCCRRYWEG